MEDHVMFYYALLGRREYYLASKLFSPVVFVSKIIELRIVFLLNNSTSYMGRV
jgi:hypothetical protein